MDKEHELKITEEMRKMRNCTGCTIIEQLEVLVAHLKLMNVGGKQ